MADDLCMMPATELVAAFQRGTLSPVEATGAALARIEAANETFNAFVIVDGERALADARAAEARWRKGAPAGLVDGVPTTVKDLLFVAGWPTRRGSLTSDPGPSAEDSAGVARLREHGAVFLGKTTTPEFGWKGVTDCALTGITRNPWDPERTPGGSSGGAAAAAALGMGALHLATDGGGSIRMPAGFCGLYGIKPTFGTVPVHPHSVMLTLWHSGPISRTVGDAALMLTVIAEADPRDWYAAPGRALDYRPYVDGGVKGLRIAYSRDLGYASVEPEVAALVEAAVRAFAEMGATVEEVGAVFEDPFETTGLMWSVGLALGTDGLSEAQRAQVEPPVLDLADPARKLSALDYRRAEQRREALGRRMQLFHQDYDLLITPQLPITAFAAGHEVPPGSGMTRWWEWSPFTYPFNLTQQPAATIPCGFAADGLPVAMQIVAAKFREDLVLRASGAYERAHPFVMPPTDQTVA